MTFTVMALAACATIPLISDYLVEPYIGSVLGIAIQPVLDNNLYLSAIIVIVLAIVLLGGLHKFRKNIRKQDVYLSGVSIDNERGCSSIRFRSLWRQPLEIGILNRFSVRTKSGQSGRLPVTCCLLPRSAGPFILRWL